MSKHTAKHRKGEAKGNNVNRLQGVPDDEPTATAMKAARRKLAARHWLASNPLRPDQTAHQRLREALRRGRISWVTEFDAPKETDVRTMLRVEIEAIANIREKKLRKGPKHLLPTLFKVLDVLGKTGLPLRSWCDSATVKAVADHFHCSSHTARRYLRVLTDLRDRSAAGKIKP